MRAPVSRSLRRGRGSTGIAYALMLGLVATISIGVVDSIGDGVQDLFGTVDSSLTNARGTGGGNGTGDEEANQPPTIDTNTGLSIAHNATGTPLTDSQLDASDPEQAAGALSFTLTSAPAHGTFYRDTVVDNQQLDGGEALGIGASFTLTDLAAGVLLYDHTGLTGDDDAIGFTLSDGSGGQTSGTVMITVGDPPQPASCVVVGDQNGYLRKYGDDGSQIWAVRPSSNRVTGLVIDSLDNIYASFADGNSFQSWQNPTLRKFDSSGTEITGGNWPVPFVGYGTVAIDGSDNLYLAQNSGDPASDNLVRRLTPNGNQTLSFSIGSNSQTNCAFGVSHDGSVLAVGMCGPPYAIRRFDATGTEELSGWPFTGHTNFPRNIAIDSAGNVYSGGDDATVRARNADGSHRWSVSNAFTPPNGKNPVHIVVNSRDELFQGDDHSALGKRDPATGAEIWSYFPAIASDNPRDLAVDDTGVVYVGLGGSTTFHLHRLRADGSHDTTNNWPLTIPADPRVLAVCAN